jgi:hypothetical protein
MGRQNISKKKQWAKIPIDKRYHSTLRRIVLKNHRTTAAQVTAELNIHFARPFPQKLSGVSFTNPTSMVGLQFLNL